MSSEGRGKPILSLAHRQIIKYCIDNSKDDLGERIYRRAIERRDDFRGFVDCLPKVSNSCQQLCHQDNIIGFFD